MKTGPMAPLPDPPCPLCSEPLAKGARRCDNCGSIVPETGRAELEEFAESLRSGDEGVKRLDSSKLLDAEGQISEELTTIPTTYLCPSCGAFVRTAEAKCSGCGAALPGGPAAAPPLSPRRPLPFPPRRLRRARSRMPLTLQRRSRRVRGPLPASRRTRRRQVSGPPPRRRPPRGPPLPPRSIKNSLAP